jgi:hypothetical protein
VTRVALLEASSRYAALMVPSRYAALMVPGTVNRVRLRPSTVNNRYG